MSPVTTEPEIVYPDSDGMPMADNTLQWEWIATIKGNLDLLFANDTQVFVAGDNLIYPVEGKPAICLAPDVYVAFGRRKGYRGSYQVWKEGGIFPQVVFEVLSPNNTAEEMERKRKFYEKYGAEEYYLIDPYAFEIEGHVRGQSGFSPVPEMNGFKSPRLQIRFRTGEEGLDLLYPGGSRFLTFVEYGQLQYRTSLQAAEERHRAELERDRAEQEKARAEQEKARAEQEKARAENLAAKLRQLGIDPEVL